MLQAEHGKYQDNIFVFCNEIGEPLSAHTVYHNYKRSAAMAMPS